jgi:hypothetical protein
MKTRLLMSAALAAAAPLAGCGPSAGEIEANAHNAEQAVEEGAEDRAENLDRLADERSAAAAREGGLAGAALRNDAERDRADAAEAISDADNSVDAIETREGAAIDRADR